MLKDVVNISGSFSHCHCYLVAFVLKTTRWLLLPHHHVLFQAERMKKEDIGKAEASLQDFTFLFGKESS